MEENETNSKDAASSSKEDRGTQEESKTGKSGTEMDEEAKGDDEIFSSGLD